MTFLKLHEQRLITQTAAAAEVARKRLRNAGFGDK